MKTKIISKLKKDLLIIEMPEGYNLDYTYYSEDNETEIAFYLNEDCVQLKTFKGSYTLLGKPDKIKEEDVKNLVEDKISGKVLGSIPLFSNNEKKTWSFTALKAFFSAIEKEIYWVNPINLIHTLEYLKRHRMYHYDARQWEEAQEKTFDKNRTLIFVKN